MSGPASRGQQSAGRGGPSQPLSSPSGSSASVENRLHSIVIDGSNIAMSHGDNVVFSWPGIQICVDYFRKRGHTDITVVVPKWRKEDGKLPDKERDKRIIERLEQSKVLKYSPSRYVGDHLESCHDDHLIIEIAIITKGIIVSNDNFRDLMTVSPEFEEAIEKRCLMYSFFNDTFIPPPDPRGRHIKVTLDEFLRKSEAVEERIDKGIAGRKPWLASSGEVPPPPAPLTEMPPPPPPPPPVAAQAPRTPAATAVATVPLVITTQALTATQVPAPAPVVAQIAMPYRRAAPGKPRIVDKSKILPGSRILPNGKWAPLTTTATAVSDPLPPDSKELYYKSNFEKPPATFVVSRDGLLEFGCNFCIEVFYDEDDLAVHLGTPEHATHRKAVEEGLQRFSDDRFELNRRMRVPKRYRNPEAASQTDHPVQELPVVDPFSEDDPFDNALYCKICNEFVLSYDSHRHTQRKT